MYGWIWFLCNKKSHKILPFFCIVNSYKTCARDQVFTCSRTPRSLTQCPNIKRHMIHRNACITLYLDFSNVTDANYNSDCCGSDI